MLIDSALRDRAAALDPQALAEIYDAYAPKIFSYIYHRTGDGTLAEDLTGDVFIRMMEAMQSDRGWNSSLQGWLYRIAHNLVVDHFRRRSKRDTVELDENWMAAENPTTTFEGLFASNQLNQAMRFLTDEQRQVIGLKFVEGLSNAEVADILGKTEGAIKALQHRGLLALREVMGAHAEL
jgi:RNA polymerase sigma-70 factor (ECF subfamily)